MSSKFLYSTTPIDLGVLQDGTFKLNVESAQLSDLTPNLPVKTDINKKLVSGLIQPSDINGSIISNPLVSDLNVGDFDVVGLPFGGTLYSLNAIQIVQTPIIASTDIKTQNITSSGYDFTNITGDLNITNQLVVPSLTNELLTSSIALTTGGINLTSDSLNFNSHSVLSATGTGTQYFMGDGSLLQYSANSGNSNFYLYKSNSFAGPPPANGFVYYNDNPQGMATTLFISHLTDDSIDIEVFFNNLNQLNDVYLQDRNNSSNYIKYNITGTPTIVIGSHITIPVLKIISSGTGEFSFGVNHDILLSFFTNNIEVDSRLSNLETKTQYQISSAGNTFFSGILTSNFVKVLGGVSTEFLKANGTVDSNTYIPNPYGLINSNKKFVKRSASQTYTLTAIPQTILGNVIPSTITFVANEVVAGDIYELYMSGKYTPISNIAPTITYNIWQTAGGADVNLIGTTFDNTSSSVVHDFTYINKIQFTSIGTGAIINQSVQLTINVGNGAPVINNYNTLYGTTLNTTVSAVLTLRATASASSTITPMILYMTKI